MKSESKKIWATPALDVVEMSVTANKGTQQNEGSRLKAQLANPQDAS